MRNEQKNIIIFTDPGMDDAIALIWLAKQKQINIKGIVPVAGNHNPKQTHRNTKKLLSMLNLSHIPIFSTLNYSQNYNILSSIHGKDGMGDITERIELGNFSFDVRDFGDIQAITDESYEILSLGPCTMLLKFLESKITNKPEIITIMGGAYKRKGNYKNGHEFNFGMDPSSVEKVFSNTECRLKVVPLDVTEKLKITSDIIQFNHFNNYSNGDSLLFEFCKRYLELARKRGVFVAVAHDLVAALSLLYPDIFTYKKGKLTLEKTKLKINQGDRDQLAVDVDINEIKIV
ncbi:nucleoside hydrolase [Natranaerofaba carboxydovora]|uniref:nucleoside hydrolase n=1 Tax=Natranaerofaba carboxydovora TaxID=2742683 RepID=UPI001F12D06C|nr:nucleoside hydrolase [Natranaerofaba carboxydovora]UMZ73715.1 Pyrimidine-specific ribonucleoside hydrolase RihA [Natranaerofaba carboxydovora]